MISPGEGVVDPQPPHRVADLPGGFLAITLPAPCRQCGGPSWLADELGSVHPCCELTWGPGGCVGCRASAMLNEQQRRRHGIK